MTTKSWSISKSDNGVYALMDEKGHFANIRIVRDGMDEAPVLATIRMAPKALAVLHVALERISELCRMVCVLSNNPRKVRIEDYAAEVASALIEAKPQ